MASSKRYPGGQSSIVFGDDTTSVPWSTSSSAQHVTARKAHVPTAGVSSGVGIIPGAGVTSGGGVASPTKESPQRAHAGRNHQSTVFSASAAEKSSPVRAHAGKNSASTIFGHAADKLESSPGTSTRIARPPGGGSTLQLAGNYPDESKRPTSSIPRPARATAPQNALNRTMQSAEAPPVHRPGRRQLGDPGHKSSVALGLPGVGHSFETTSSANSSMITPPVSRPSSPGPIKRVTSPPPQRKLAAGSPSRASPSASKSHFASSFTFGDDSPPSPDFSPRKHRPGRKNLAPPGGGLSPVSLATLGGGDTTLSFGAVAAEPASKRVDPSTVKGVAGTSTGKHRVY
ncbi:hypothetical protein DFS34DRAFT_595657 [Phlyctochytrium arcticum]|nr:hypothetical protein DFS34DRAFT_595657 [Phlyctochytrium arcticum]